MEQVSHVVFGVVGLDIHLTYVDPYHVETNHRISRETDLVAI